MNRIAALLILGVFDWGSPSTRAMDEVVAADEILAMTSLTPVSDSFREQTRAAIHTIPKNVQRLVAAAGWRIQLASFVVDVQPDLADDRPRGWPADLSWSHTDAIHFPAERLLVVAENRRTRQGLIVAATRVAGVLRHELGHAFDMAAAKAGPFRSATPEFQTAYATDVSQLSPHASQDLAYYLQDQNAGRQEAFAEAFGILLGGGSDVTKEEVFRTSFPQVLAFVRRELDFEVEK